jgi:hypothetical protein
MIDDSSSVVERMFLLLLLSLELAVIVKVINFDQKKKENTIGIKFVMLYVRKGKKWLEIDSRDTSLINVGQRLIFGKNRTGA